MGVAAPSVLRRYAPYVGRQVSFGAHFQDVMPFGLQFFGSAARVAVVAVECALVAGVCRVALISNLAFAFMGVVISDGA